MKENKKTLAIEWLEKAESDLNFARASFRELNSFYSHICILCHDAVEKFSKAYVISLDKKPAFVHDLLKLLNECKKNSADFEEFVEDFRILNRYYIPLKYPSHYPSLSKEQAKEAIEITEKFEKFIKAKIY